MGLRLTEKGERVFYCKSKDPIINQDGRVTPIYYIFNNKSQLIYDTDSLKDLATELRAIISNRPTIPLNKVPSQDGKDRLEHKLRGEDYDVLETLSLKDLSKLNNITVSLAA